MAFGKGLTCALLFMFSASTFSATVPTETLELSPSLESSVALVNGSTITNLTDLTPLNGLPPDPFMLWPWAGARSISVTFSSYKPGIWLTDALNAILDASRDAAIANFRGDGNNPISKDLKYIFGSITLTLVPGSSLTWREWGLALTAFTGLFNQYEYTGFSFTVNVAYRPAGSGFLSGGTPPTPQTTPQAA